MGPGLYKATKAIISSNLFGFICFKTSLIPVLSNWNIPMVSPVVKSSKVFTSSNGIFSISKFSLFFLINSIVFLMTVRVLRPRKSNFTNPASSDHFISNCVTGIGILES